MLAAAARKYDKQSHRTIRADGSSYGKGEVTENRYICLSGSDRESTSSDEETAENEMDEESDEDQEEINHGGKSHQEDKARQRAGDILQDSGQILSLNASQHRTPNEEGENYEAGDVFNGKTIHAVLDDRDVSNFTIGDACAALLSANTAFEEDVPELPPSGVVFAIKFMDNKSHRTTGPKP